MLIRAKIKDKKKKTKKKKPRKKRVMLKRGKIGSGKKTKQGDNADQGKKIRTMLIIDKNGIMLIREKTEQC